MMEPEGFWTKVPHCNPWWKCYGCWRQIVVTAAVVAWVALALHNHFCGR